MKDIIIVRDRGQLTIPDKIRKSIDWIHPLSPVSITVTQPNEIVIRPHLQNPDWDTIWNNIHRSRAIKGKGNKSAAAFIEDDRRSH